MKFLRNPEVMVCVIIYSTVTVIATAVALTRSDRMAICVFLLCAVLFAVYLISTSKRYKKSASCRTILTRSFTDRAA